MLKQWFNANILVGETCFIVSQMCNTSAKKAWDGLSHDKFELRIDQREVIVCARRAGSLG
jgi:hypothetical protein